MVRVLICEHAARLEATLGEVLQALDDALACGSRDSQNQESTRSWP
jgi:hypothetical protein